MEDKLKKHFKKCKKKTCNLKNGMLQWRRSRWQQKKSLKKLLKKFQKSFKKDLTSKKRYATMEA